jgi:hypothetical protein
MLFFRGRPALTSLSLGGRASRRRPETTGRGGRRAAVVDQRIDPSARPPRRPSGTDSLFRCKGHLYLGFFEVLELHATKEQLYERLESDELRDFARQPFMTASWYPTDPILALGEAAARLTMTSYADFLTQMARRQAVRDVGGVYRFMLKLTNSSTVVERLPRMANRYFEFVRSELATPPTSPAVLIVSGIPENIAATYRLVTEPYITRAMELAGAKNIVHKIGAFEPDGLIARRAIVKFTRTISWV